MMLRGITIFYNLLLLQECISYYYPPLFWHKDNCAFRRLQESTGTNDTKEYFINVIPEQGMNIVCPNDVTVNNWLEEDATLSNNLLENVWLVDKEGFDKCRVNEKGDPKFNKLFLTCDNPNTLKYRLFAFHPRYNMDGEPKFAVGHHYYFISTSRGYRHDLSTRKVSGPQGSCESYHMKLHIYVCDPKKEDCVWHKPRCDPPKELKRDMMVIDGKLPALTLPPATKPKTQITKTTRATPAVKISPKEPKNVLKTPQNDQKNSVETTPISKIDVDYGNPKPICVKKKKETSTQLILNFVLGGVALFMAVVIIILVFGLSSKAKDYDVDRPVSTVSSSHEANRYIYMGSMRYSDGHRELSLVSRTPPKSPNVITGQSVQTTQAPQPNKPEGTPLLNNEIQFVFPTQQRHSFDGVAVTAEESAKESSSAVPTAAVQ